MADLISRQAAIKEIARWIGYIDEDMILRIQTGLKKMPSAQPEADEWCADCKEYDRDKHCCPRWNRVIRTALDEAEPERKRGRWINDRLVTTNGGTYAVRRCPFCESYYQDVGYGWDYCPNCGADMRGEEK